MLRHILKQGYTLLWTDSDMVWLGNPLPLLPDVHDSEAVSVNCVPSCIILRDKAINCRATRDVSIACFLCGKGRRRRRIFLLQQ